MSPASGSDGPCFALEIPMRKELLTKFILMITLLMAFTMGLTTPSEAGLKKFYLQQKDKVQKAAQIVIVPVKINGTVFWQREITIDVPSIPDLFKFVTVPFPILDMSTNKSVSFNFKKIYRTQEEAQNIVDTLEILKKIPWTSKLLNSTLKVGESFSLTTDLAVSAGLKSPQLFGFAPVGANGGQMLKGKFNVLVRKISESQIELFLVRQHQQGQSFSSSVGSQIDMKSFANLNIAGFKLSELNPQFFNYNRNFGSNNSEASGFKVDLATKVGRDFYNSIMRTTLVGEDLAQIIHMTKRNFTELESEQKNRQPPALEQQDLGVTSGSEFSASRNLGYLNRQTKTVSTQNTHLKFRNSHGEMKNYLVDETVFYTQKKKVFGFWSTHLQNLSTKALYEASDLGKESSLIGFEFTNYFSSTSESKKEYKIWLDSIRNFVPELAYTTIQEQNWFDEKARFAPRLSVASVFPKSSYDILSARLENMTQRQKENWFADQIITYMENKKWPEANLLRKCWNGFCKILTSESSQAERLIPYQEVESLAKKLANWSDGQQPLEQQKKSFVELSQDKLFASISAGFLSAVVGDEKGELLETKINFKYQNEEQKYVSKRWESESVKNPSLFENHHEATGAFELFAASKSKYTRPLPSALTCVKVFDSSL